MAIKVINRPLQLSVDEKEYVNVPLWAGIGSIVVGGLLLIWRDKN